jgi:hypothetical protein
MNERKLGVGIILAGILGALIVFTVSSENKETLRKSDSSKDSQQIIDLPKESPTYRKYETNEDDGYVWAEENDVSSFDECQDQFGTGSAEDECNRYVRENYSDDNTFRGYDCTEDCSGHEAGYAWAEDNGVSDEYDCDGNSNSFNEGCMAYVQENY